MATITVPGMFLTGDHASRPAATAVGKGTLYSCTTHSLIYQTTDGATWVTWLTAGSTVSAGSNSTRVRELSTAGASSTLWSPFDHAHDGIGTITASSSNTLQRGTFNLRTGNNISFGLTDTDGDGEFDTVTIHGAAAGVGGGSSLTVADEGTPLATAATTLDFVGAGVVATGSGATKTITIAGGSSASGLDGYTLDATYGDHFTSSSLAAIWTRRNFTSGAEVRQFGPDATHIRIDTNGRSAGDGYFQTAPGGDWTFAMKSTDWFIGSTDGKPALSPCVVDSSGNGVVAQIYSSPDAMLVAALSSYTYGGSFSQGTTFSNTNIPLRIGLPLWQYLRKSGTDYYGAFSFNGETWSPETALKNWTGTVDRVGMIAPLGFAAASTHFVDVDWFNKIA